MVIGGGGNAKSMRRYISFSCDVFLVLGAALYGVYVVFISYLKVNVRLIRMVFN